MTAVASGSHEEPRTFVEHARRRQIVDAAIEVLAEESDRGATFVRIAERAGISPSLISYHFSSRAELMAQVVSQIVADMDRVITADLEAQSGYRAVLRALIESQVRYFAEQTSAVIALGHLAHGGDPAIARQLADHRTRTLSELEELLLAGQRAGELAPFAPRPMAVTLLAALEAVPGEFFARPGTDPGAYGRELADLFDAALSRPGGLRGSR